MPRRRRTSCGCRRRAWSSSARRSRFEPRGSASVRPRLSDLSLPAATAGLVAVLVGFTSSVAIVFRAATALGADTHEIASWMWALGWGMGLGSLLPSLWWRKPVMVAWSTPGAAVLATAAASGAYTMPEAVGAFLACG